MNIEMLKVYLKKLTENTGDLYSLKIFSDGSGCLATIQDEEILSWDDEGRMYQALLSMITTSNSAKEALLNLLSESKL